MNILEGAQKDFDSVLDSITRKDLAKMLYESEVEKEKLQKTVKVQEKQIRDLRMRINSGENIPERVTHLEQLVLPGFDSTSQNFTPKPQTIEPVEGRIKPSKAKTRYPGALLVYEMRARLQREKGITLRAKDIFAWLNREKWLLTSDSVYNMPSDMAVNQGWILPTWGTGRQESNKTFYTPRFTEKGYQYFLECIKRNGGIL